MNFGQSIANVFARERQFTEGRIQQVRDLNFRAKQLEVQDKLVRAQESLSESRVNALNQETREKEEANSARDQEFYQKEADNTLRQQTSSIEANDASTSFSKAREAMLNKQGGLTQAQTGLVNNQTKELQQKISFVEKQLAAGGNPFASGGGSDTTSDDILRITESIPEYQQLYNNAKRITESTDSSISDAMKASAKQEMQDYSDVIRRFTILQAQIIRRQYPDYGSAQVDSLQPNKKFDLSDITNDSN